MATGVSGADARGKGAGVRVGVGGDLDERAAAGAEGAPADSRPDAVAPEARADAHAEHEGARDARAGAGEGFAALVGEASPEALAMLDLMRDPLYPRAHPDDLARLARASAALGRTRAEVVGPRSTRELQEAFEALGYPVRRLACDPPGLRAGWRLQAQVTLEGPDRRVDLYTGQLQAKADALTRLGLPATLEDMERLHLAHELFHLAECREGRAACEQAGPVRVRRALLGGWRMRVLAAASEAAAHAFAAAVALPPAPPELADYAVLVDEGALTVADVRARLERAQTGRGQTCSSADDIEDAQGSENTNDPVPFVS